MLNVEIKTWEYDGGRFQVRAYADPERKLYGLNICTSDGYADKREAYDAAVRWLDKEHGGHWQLIA